MRRYHITEDKRHPLGRLHPARIVLGLAFLLTAPAALAQFSGTLAVLSDYRFRGRSLNDDHATPQLTLNFDSNAGWFAGAMGAHATVADTGTPQLIAYGGFARRLANGVGWEAGATQTVFTRIGSYNYSEAFVGLSGEQISARLYYAPRYFGRPARTAYAEANGFLRLGETLRLVGHAGLLHAFAGEEYVGQLSNRRYDFQLGLAARVGDFDLQLARATRAARRYPAYAGYPAYVGPEPHAFVFSAAYSF
jgi:uncharacterized protein (TIGR02001 family)